MKLYLFSALTIMLTAATAPAVQAAKDSTNSLQSSRLEHLDTQTKAVENIQAERLEGLDTRSKAVENIQAERLDYLDTQTKAVKDIQSKRLEHLENQTKAVEDVQFERLDSLDARSRVVEDSQDTLDPSKLAFLAYRGELYDQGIQGYQDLTMQYQFGQIAAQDVVAAAIEAGYLTGTTLDDDDYISAVARQLSSIINGY